MTMQKDSINIVFIHGVFFYHKIFYKKIAKLFSNYNFIFIERYNEYSSSTMNQSLLNIEINNLQEKLKKISGNFILIGHSLGFILSYLAAQRDENLNNKILFMFAVSGFTSFKLSLSEEKIINDLTMNCFKLGIDKEIINQCVIGAKNDFCLIEDINNIYPLRIRNNKYPLCMIHGDSDTTVSIRRAIKAAEELKANYFYKITGNHNFIIHNPECIFNIIDQMILSSM